MLPIRTPDPHHDPFSDGCPRCLGGSVLALVAASASTFDWRECGECSYLWPVLKPFTFEPEPRFVPSGK